MTAEWYDVGQAWPGLRGGRVHVLPAAAEEPLRAALAAAGFRIHVLEGAAVTGDDSFFAALAHALPLPPHFGHNWDALIDALGDFCETPGRAALLWRNAEACVAADAQTFIDATRALDAAASDAGSRDDDAGAMQLEVFLLGDTAAFGATTPLVN